MSINLSVVVAGNISLRLDLACFASINGIASRKTNGDRNMQIAKMRCF